MLTKDDLKAVLRFRFAVEASIGFGNKTKSRLTTAIVQLQVECNNVQGGTYSAGECELGALFLGAREACGVGTGHTLVFRMQRD